MKFMTSRSSIPGGAPLTATNHPRRFRRFPRTPTSPPPPPIARGELDRHTVDLLWGTIDVLLRAGHHRITLDLAEVSSIDAAGVKLLVALQRSLATHCGELTVTNARPLSSTPYNEAKWPPGPCTANKATETPCPRQPSTSPPRNFATH